MSRPPNPARLVRPLIRQLHGYIPGEQPRIRGLVKLNTNENPFPPAPSVLAALQSALDGRLRLYPNPTAQELRQRLARLHRCRPENIIVGNGSDDLLALATRAFVEPNDSRAASGLSARTVQYFAPSYSLYPVLADSHGAVRRPVDLEADFQLSTPQALAARGLWDFKAALTFITTPNAPSGTGYATKDLAALCRAQRGVVVLDEAYVDFAPENALQLALQFPHVLVARTFSKFYSLCFLRVGYFVGHPVLIAALDKLRDSYNVNGLGQVAATATLANMSYYRANRRKIIATRERLSDELRELGFTVLPSATNFIFVIPPGPSAQTWLGALRRRKILVRWFNQPRIRNYLRITIGTETEGEALVTAVRRILR